MFTIDTNKCTGCGACVQRCPRKCISWKKGELGFNYPTIDEKLCIECGLCKKVCSVEKVIDRAQNQKVYAAVHENAEVLRNSTSGGAFTAIADAIFDKGGIVYGVTMSADMQIHHIRVENRVNLNQLRGSKYVQSHTGNTYCQVEQDLKEGKTVLYSGTPCQIDGLHHFLLHKYPNLYTVDIVCHGVGSQGYFDKYMEFAGKRYDHMLALHFRSKDFAGWSCAEGAIITLGKDGRRKKLPYHSYDNYYYAYFLSGDIYRKSCYSCKYANTNRVADFTLGDYWGVEALKLPLDTKNGCSLIIANSMRAKNLLKNICTINLIETTIEQAVHCNAQLKGPSVLPTKRMRLVEEFESMSGHQIQNAYLRSHSKSILKGIVKSLIPYELKRCIRSLRK